MYDVFNTFMPTLLESTAKGERTWDVASRLFHDRIIMLSSEINRAVATNIVAQILVLQHLNPEGEIQMLINSPGGEVIAGFAIYDMIKLTSCPVKTICIGEACSAASFILAGGTKGRRYILENARVLLHQPWGGVKGQVTDIQIQFNEMQYMKDKILEILHTCTGQDKQKLSIDLERDHILRGQEVIKYGLVDHVMQKGD